MTLRSDWLGELISMKDVLKSASMRHGVPSVMDHGQLMMPMLPVDNWDLQPLVNLITFLSG